MEAFELLMEAEEYGAAADLLVGNTELLAHWGFGRDSERVNPDSTRIYGDYCSFSASVYIEKAWRISSSI